MHRIAVDVGSRRAGVPNIVECFEEQTERQHLVTLVSLDSTSRAEELMLVAPTVHADLVKGLLHMIQSLARDVEQLMRVSLHVL